MTCHNRRDTTIACLDKLMSQEGSDGFNLQVYLVDDCFTDGTGEAVGMRFPRVKVLQGDGELFWCGGMRLAFGEALEENFDYCLWLNDDSMLFLSAVRTMVDTSRCVKIKMAQDVIVVGAMCDAKTGELTYGGSKRHSRWRPM